MGTDKAELSLEGEPLWRRQERVLREAGAEAVVLVRRPDQRLLAGEDRRTDVFTKVGPLAGIQVALAPGPARWVAVLAVDMPGIDASWFRWLFSFCRPGCGAMARHAEACEPLAAIYPAEALAEVDFRLRHGDHSLQRLALALAGQGRLALLPLPEDRGSAVRSVNCPEDWAELNRRSARQSFPSPSGTGR